MDRSEIVQLLINLEIIAQSALQCAERIKEKQEIKDFERLKLINSDLRKVVGHGNKAIFDLQDSLATKCPECACENIFVDWDCGIAKCLREACRHHWSVVSGVAAENDTRKLT